MYFGVKFFILGWFMMRLYSFHDFIGKVGGCAGVNSIKVEEGFMHPPVQSRFSVDREEERCQLRGSVIWIGLLKGM